MIVRFLNYNDRQLIWGKPKLLENCTMSMSENFAAIVEHRRKLLYPIIKKARKSPKYPKSFFKGDKLVVDDAEYSLCDMASLKLPDDFNPMQFETKSNESWRFSTLCNCINFITKIHIIYFRHTLVALHHFTSITTKIIIKYNILKLLITRHEYSD